MKSTPISLHHHLLGFHVFPPFALVLRVYRVLFYCLFAFLLNGCFFPRSFIPFIHLSIHTLAHSLACEYFFYSSIIFRLPFICSFPCEIIIIIIWDALVMCQIKSTDVIYGYLKIIFQLCAVIDGFKSIVLCCFNSHCVLLSFQFAYNCLHLYNYKSLSISRRVRSCDDLNTFFFRFEIIHMKAWKKLNSDFISIFNVEENIHINIQWICAN